MMVKWDTTKILLSIPKVDSQSRFRNSWNIIVLISTYLECVVYLTYFQPRFKLNKKCFKVLSSL